MAVDVDGRHLHVTLDLEQVMRRTRRVRTKLSREGLSRDQRLELISRAARARRVDKLVFGSLVFSAVAATVFITVSTRLVTDYRALLICVVAPTLLIYVLYDPIKILALQVVKFLGWRSQ